MMIFVYQSTSTWNSMGFVHLIVNEHRSEKDISSFALVAVIFTSIFTITLVSLLVNKACRERYRRNPFAKDVKIDQEIRLDDTVEIRTLTRVYF